MPGSSEGQFETPNWLLRFIKKFAVGSPEYVLLTSNETKSTSGSRSERFWADGIALVGYFIGIQVLRHPDNTMGDLVEPCFDGFLARDDSDTKICSIGQSPRLGIVWRCAIFGVAQSVVRFGIVGIVSIL